MKTFYVENNEINNNEIVLKNDEHNHLKNVLRLNVGDEIKVVCNSDYNYFCKIIEINKTNSKLEILNKELNTCNPKTDLTVYMSLIKNDNLHLTIQKLTELGVTTLVPFISRFTVIKDVNQKHEKLQLISNQSIKQCGRSKPMMVMPTKNIKELNFVNYDLVVFANESEKSKSLIDTLNQNLNAKKIAIIIGCEGGFTDDEKQTLINKNAVSISLGKRILRAETAAIMLSSIALYTFGEYD